MFLNNECLIVLFFLLVILIKPAIVVYKSSPLNHFQLESMLNYDVLICTGFPRKYDKEFKQQASYLTLTITDHSIDVLKHFKLKHRLENNIIIILAPKTESEFFIFTNEISSTLDEDDSNGKDHSYIFLIWPSHLKLESRNDMTTIMSNITAKSFTLTSSVFVIFAIETLPLSLWEIYSIKSETFVNEISIFTNIVFTNILAKSSWRNDFHGINIVAIATNDTYYEAESKYTNGMGNLELESGFAVSLYRDLKYILNFSESSLPGDWMYISNQTLMGTQAEAILQDEADICIAQNVMRPNLAQQIMFLHPTYPLSVIVFFLEPSLGTLVEIYNEPFNIYIWTLLLIMLFGIPVLIKLFIKYLSMNSKMNEIDTKFATESIIWAIGTASQKGWYIFPHTLPLRILVFTGSLAGVVIYGAYSAALVSKLSVRGSPIQSLKDLLNHEYTIIFNRDSVSLREYTKGMESYYKIPRILGSQKPELGYMAMKRQIALLTYWEGIQNMYPIANSLQYICNELENFQIENTVVQTGMTLKKGSPYKEIFNQKILQLKEKGLNNRYARYYSLEIQPQCLLKSIVRHEPLDLRSIFSAHLLLLAGIFGSVILLALEIQILKKQEISNDLSETSEFSDHTNFYLREQITQSIFLKRSNNNRFLQSDSRTQFYVD